MGRDVGGLAAAAATAEAARNDGDALRFVICSIDTLIMRVGRCRGSQGDYRLRSHVSFTAATWSASAFHCGMSLIRLMSKGAVGEEGRAEAA